MADKYGVIEVDGKRSTRTASAARAMFATIGTQAGSIVMRVTKTDKGYEYEIHEDSWELPDGRDVGSYRHVASGVLPC